MEVIFEKSFLKDSKKVPEKIKKAAHKRLKLFLKEPFHPLLHLHTLHGEFAEFSSINVTGNYRLVLKYTEDRVILYRLGTHSQLYR